MIKNIAIFASGEGTNAQNIIEYFKTSDRVKVAIVVSNRSTANVLIRAKRNNIPTLLVDKNSFCDSDSTIEHLKKLNIDLIVLAGFLWMIPENLIAAYPNKIVNIHPALLPKYGGKGMFGINVHKAVIDLKEKESGISIHFVNEHYDKGEIIAQYKCKIEENDTAETLANKIHQLEYEYYPKIINDLLLVK